MLFSCAHETEEEDQRRLRSVYSLWEPYRLELYTRRRRGRRYWLFSESVNGQIQCRSSNKPKSTLNNTEMDTHDRHTGEKEGEQGHALFAQSNCCLRKEKK